LGAAASSHFLKIPLRSFALDKREAITTIELAPFYRHFFNFFRSVSMITYFERYAEIEPINKLGLSRIEAAAYIGLSPSTFDKLVVDGRMPQPVRIDARAVWDRKRVEDAWARLVNGGGGMPVADDSWDAVLPAAMRRVG
jgi:predicted DNA-binding transcriptional regulator AlpA